VAQRAPTTTTATATATTTPDADGLTISTTTPDRDEVARWLDAVSQAVDAEVGRLRASDPDTDPATRGLYVSHAFADSLLVRRAAAPIANSPARDVIPTLVSPTSRLSLLAERFALDDADLALLVIAAAPDVDDRLSTLYGYCQDDLSLRCAGAGFALRLAGLDPLDATDRARLSQMSRLVDDRLLEVDDNAVWPRRQLRVADRILAFLLGDDEDIALALHPLIVDPSRADSPVVARICAAMRSGERLIHVRDTANGMAAAVAAAACDAVGIGVLAIDLTFLSDDDRVDDLIADAIREAHLQGAGLVLGPVEELLAHNRGSLRRLQRAGWPVILYGDSAWDPRLLTTAPVTFAVAPSTRDERVALWQQALPADTSDVATQVGHLRLSPSQIVRAAQLAVTTAAAEQRAVDAAGVEAAARAQNTMALEKLTRRVDPRADWSSLVLPDAPLQQLQGLVRRVRDSDRVAAMRVGGDASARRGTVAVFSGPSGTGKTLSSEVVAHALGLTLYAVNLATVVDKYIGETEKNLDRIFTQAVGINGLLFFDEADALFGKRSDVKDARDRYANLEVAYLLQRLENFDGVAVLATNLAANLDQAFLRRIDVFVRFPEPDHVARRALWDKLLGTTLPRAADVDLDYCAQSFTLAGGDIRNIALSAACLAVAEDRPLSMLDLMRTTQEEYRKLGRLATADEFGGWLTDIGS
jgi:hypothetical protein